MVANFGLPNMYLLGEWFLGFIVIFYFFFPIMLWGVQRFPWITAVVGVAIWGGFLFWWYSGTHYVAPAIFLPVRIIELFFGIYIAQYWKKLPVWTVVPALGVLIASSVLPQIPEDIATTFVGIAAFVILAVLAEFLDRQPIRKVIAWVSKYSYAIFLVHHVIIMVMFSLFPITTYGTAAKYFAFGNICVLTGVCGYVLFHVHRYVMKGAFAGIAKVGGTKATSHHSCESSLRQKGLSNTSFHRLSLSYGRLCSQGKCPIPVGENRAVRV
ncbi:acyltransferase [Actinotignum urinale]|nr:acyltransferase [Actinotignum urinale]MDY5151919.1 acyltransferase [Actinotignum urinale]